MAGLREARLAEPSIATVQIPNFEIVIKDGARSEIRQAEDTGLEPATPEVQLISKHPRQVDRKLAKSLYLTSDVLCSCVSEHFNRTMTQLWHQTYLYP